MTKKILLIIGILIIIGVAAFLVLFSAPKGEGESEAGFSVREFLPFGKSEDTTTSPSPVTPKEEEAPPNISTIDGVIPRLRKISGEPVAGAVIFNAGPTSTVRFVEKGTGNVYEARSDTTTIQRLTNTTIPKIVRAFWLPNGSGFLAQTLVPESEIVETSFVKLSKNSTSTAEETLTPFGTTISKLPTDIKEISIKPDGSKIFYYTASGSSDWFVSNPDGSGVIQIMHHPLTEWLPKWISPSFIMMQSKSSSAGIGYNFYYNAKNGDLEKVGAGILGLSSNPNADGSLNLISSGGLFPRLFLSSSKDASLVEINVNTLAEKCVWLKEKSPTVYCAIPNQIPKSNYPDDWYQGIVSTEDSIEKININDGIFYLTADLSSISGQKIDVVDLSLSPDESHLIFRNKIDGYLWLLRIEE